MSEHDHGGPAFPYGQQIISRSYYDGETVSYENEPGMTLRDYFAARAMAALLPLCNNDAREEGLSYPEHIAAVSYGMADAMLKARYA